MSNKMGKPKSFRNLEDEDKDLTMFSITNLTLAKDKHAGLVSMAIKLKRKVVTELMTTYLPTILILIIVYTTNFFKAFFFEAVVTVNLTALLVLTTLFISVSGKAKSLDEGESL